MGNVHDQINAHDACEISFLLRDACEVMFFVLFASLLVVSLTRAYGAPVHHCMTPQIYELSTVLGASSSRTRQTQMPLHPSHLFSTMPIATKQCAGPVVHRCFQADDLTRRKCGTLSAPFVTRLALIRGTHGLNGFVSMGTTLRGVVR